MEHQANTTDQQTEILFDREEVVVDNKPFSISEYRGILQPDSMPASEHFKFVSYSVRSFSVLDDF